MYVYVVPGNILDRSWSLLH